MKTGQPSKKKNKWIKKKNPTLVVTITFKSVSPVQSARVLWVCIFYLTRSLFVAFYGEKKKDTIKWHTKSYKY